MNTTSLARATSAGEAPSAAPGRDQRLDAGPAAVPDRRASCPASSRCLAIGRPMIPSPMNPTRMALPPLGLSQDHSPNLSPCPAKEQHSVRLAFSSLRRVPYIAPQEADMRPNTVKQLWRDGKCAVGGWLSVPSTYSAEIMAHQGFDWLCIDTQHGAIDYSAGPADAAGDLDDEYDALRARALERALDHHEVPGRRRLRHHRADDRATAPRPSRRSRPAATRRPVSAAPAPTASTSTPARTTPPSTPTARSPAWS